MLRPFGFHRGFHRSFSSFKHFATKPDINYVKQFSSKFMENCPGCGAKFHSDDACKPGFVKDLSTMRLAHLEYLKKELSEGNSSALDSIPSNAVEEIASLIQSCKVSNMDVGSGENQTKEKEDSNELHKGDNRSLESYFYPFLKKNNAPLPKRHNETMKKRFGIPYGVLEKLNPELPLEPQLQDLGISMASSASESASSDSISIDSNSAASAAASEPLSIDSNSFAEYPDSGNETVSIFNDEMENESLEDLKQFNERSNKEKRKIIKPLVCRRCKSLFFDEKLPTQAARLEWDDNWNWTREEREFLRNKIGKYSLIIMVVDVLDFPVSFIPNIYGIFHQNSKIILVGNKIDLLPSDIQYDALKTVLRKAAEASGILNIQDTILVSAKNGTNLEELGSIIYNFGSSGRSYEYDAFLVGCTNSGKSSIWNGLMKKFKIKNIPLVTESLEPGTTVGLPSIEISNFKSAKTTFTPNPLKCKPQGCLYDTPGIFHEASALNYLNLQEIKAVAPKKTIKPLSWRLDPNRTLFIAGLYRIDYVQGSRQVTVTLCLEPNVPIHMTSLEKADEEYKENAACYEDILSPPFGGHIRMAQFPPLKKTIEGFIYDKKRVYVAERDFILPGIGWFNISGYMEKDEKAVLDIWSPNGIRIEQRDSIFPIAPKIGSKGGLHGGVRSKYHPRKELPKVIFLKALRRALRERKKEVAAFVVKKRQVLAEVLAKLRRNPENEKLSPDELSELAWTMVKDRLESEKPAGPKERILKIFKEEGQEITPELMEKLEKKAW